MRLYNRMMIEGSGQHSGRCGSKQRRLTWPEDKINSDTENQYCITPAVASAVGATLQKLAVWLDRLRGCLTSFDRSCEGLP